jgi:hypothetical protein
MREERSKLEAGWRWWGRLRAWGSRKDKAVRRGRGVEADDDGCLQNNGEEEGDSGRKEMLSRSHVSVCVGG